MKGEKRITAGILLSIYVGMMHPAVMYGEETGRSKEMAIGGQRTALRRAGEKIRAAEGGLVRLGDAEVAIPAGALERDTEISITRLERTEDTGERKKVRETASGGMWEED